jgi:hypothetical protein
LTENDISIDGVMWQYMDIAMFPPLNPYAHFSIRSEVDTCFGLLLAEEYFTPQSTVMGLQDTPIIGRKLGRRLSDADLFGG